MKNKKKLQRTIVILLWVFALLFSAFNFRHLLFADNLLLKYDWGFATFDWSKTWHDATSSWNDYFLGQGVGINAAWLPLALLAAFGTLLQLSVSQTLMVVIVLCSAVAMVGMTLLLKNRGVNWYLSIIAGILYAFAPVIFIRVIVGFLFYLIAYALAPFIIRYWYIATEQSHRTWHQFVFPILFAIASAQPQFVVMLTLIFIIDWVFSPSIRYFKKAFSLLIFAFVTTAIVHLPWLVNLLRNGFSTVVKINEEGSSLANIEALPHSLIRTFIGADHHITFPIIEKVFEQKLFVAAAFMLVILSILAVIKINRREVKTFFIALALAWPLALGTQIPTNNLFSYLYLNLPFSNLFREVYHWSFLITISLVFLSIFVINALTQKMMRSKSGKWLMALVLLLPIFWLTPFWQTDFYGYMPNNYKIPQSYEMAKASHEVEESRLTRSLFLPSFGFIKFIDDNSPGAANNDIYAFSTNRAQIPYNSSVLDSADNATEIRNAMLTALHNKDSNFTALLNATAVNNIFYRNTLTSEFAQLFDIDRGQAKDIWQNVSFEDLLQVQDVELISTLPALSEYRFESAPMFEFDTAPKISASDLKQIKINQNIIYLEDLTLNQTDSIEGLTEVGNEKDIIAAKNKDKSLMSKLHYVPSANLYDGLVSKKFSWWWNKELAYNNDDYVFTASVDNLNEISGQFNAQSQDVLVAKLWFSPNSERALFKLGNSSESISTAAKEAKWQWVEVKQFDIYEQGDISISGVGEFGLANILLLPRTEWNKIDEDNKDDITSQALGDKNKVDQKAIINTVNFNKINSGEYQISTSLDEDGWLVFKMGFDAGWKLISSTSELSPIPINSYAMAWPIKKESADYSLIYEPQKPYTVIQLSAVAYLVFLILLAVSTKKREEVV